MTDLDTPTWERNWRGVLMPEHRGQVGVAHERSAAPTVAPLVWTRRAPNAEGFWWNRPADNPNAVTVLFVFRSAGGFLYAVDPGGKSYRDVRTMYRDEWAGPLTEPVEAEQ